MLESESDRGAYLIGRPNWQHGAKAALECALERGWRCAADRHRIDGIREAECEGGEGCRGRLQGG